jgi:hypothetical protein
MVKQVEQAIPWNPVPKGANVYMLLQVARFEQQALAEGTPVSMTVVASTEERPPQRGAWRIDFTSVAGFRCLSIAQPPGGGNQLTYLGKNNNLLAATWEVVHSRWLPEAIGTLHGRPQAVHHYVIANSYTIYDIAAQGWTSEALEEWIE